MARRARCRRGRPAAAQDVVRRRSGARNTSNMPPAGQCPSAWDWRQHLAEPAQQGRPRLQAHQGFLSAPPERPGPGPARSTPSSPAALACKGPRGSLEKAPFRKAWKLATPRPSDREKVWPPTLRGTCQTGPAPASSSTLMTTRSIKARARRGIHRAEAGHPAAPSRSTPPASKCRQRLWYGMRPVRVALARERGNLGGRHDELGIHHLEAGGGPARARASSAARARAPPSVLRSRRTAPGLRRGRWGLRPSSFPGPALGLLQLVGIRHRAGREVAGRHLGVHLHAGVGGMSSSGC